MYQVVVRLIILRVQCENSKNQDNIETIINVRKQQIKHIEVQLRYFKYFYVYLFII